ncbi:MAG: archaetidylserine decarboxylase [Gemmatimonadota bacterium]
MTVPFPWKVFLLLIRALPQASLSRATGWLAHRPIPPRLRSPVLGFLARLLGMDLSEAERSLGEYPSFGALFVRRLAPGRRPLDGDPNTLVSPVDGIVGEWGTISHGTALQAKGIAYSVDELLGGEGDGEIFRGGSYLTIYLSPRHYHRIHAPAAGGVVQARHLPGALLPVNAPAVASIPHLFPRNERLVAWLSMEGKVSMALAAVGAFNVGRISATFDPQWNQRPHAGEGVTNRKGRGRPETRLYDPAIPVPRGGELMAFHLGSTVVLLLPPGFRITAPPPGTEVRMGEGLARPITRTRS